MTRPERQLSSSEPEEASDLVSTDEESEGELLGGDTVDVEAESAWHGKRVLLCNLRNSGNLTHSFCFGLFWTFRALLF